MKFTVAMLQMAPEGMDQERNLAKGLKWCRMAKEHGADLALFPEMWNIGCTRCPEDLASKAAWEALSIDRSSKFFGSFLNLASSLQMSIAVTYLERHSPMPRNSVSIIDRKGEVLLNYSKVFICDFGTDGSDYNISPGDSFEVRSLETGEGTLSVGAMICADREFPEAAGRLMLNGAELIVVPNACTWDDPRRAQLQTRAFDNLACIAMTNYPSPNANGRSSAFHPVCWDEYGTARNTCILEAPADEGLYLAAFDLDEMRKFRETEKWRMDYRRIRGT